MRVVAVVVNWNGGEENLACLHSLLAQGLSQGDIVFVDNGSGRGTFPQVRATFPGLTYVLNAGNEGYARGCNQGIEIALGRGAEHVFLMNNDVELPAGVLDALCALLEREPGVGIVGPLVLYTFDKGRVWSAGGRVDYRQNLTTLLGHGRPDGDRWRTTREVDFVPGCAMLLRCDMLRRTGAFDEGFFAYHEDADLCVRARTAGFSVVCLGSEIAFHDPHSTTGGGYNGARKYMMGVNSIWFLRKYGTLGRWSRFVVFDVLSLPVLLLASPFRSRAGRTGAVLAKARGILDGLRGRRVTASVVERLLRPAQPAMLLPPLEKVES